MSSYSRLPGRTPFPSDESSTRARHLLRALLREASYLPDATCRTFVHHRVIARYRDYPQHHATLEAKFENLLQLGYKNLRQLQRANNGEVRGLVRVLEHTYGRAGKRRYELMKPLLQEQPSSDGEEQASTLGGEKPETYGHPLALPRAVEGPFKTKRDTLQFRISDRFPLLRSLVYSQSKQSPRLYGDRHLKSVSLEMPLKNLWQRVQPRKRQTNAATKWYAETLDKVMPPLPEDEWTRLRQLALGEIPWTGPPRKRPSSRTRNLPLDLATAYPTTALPLIGSDAVDNSQVYLNTLLEGELQIRPSRMKWPSADGRDVGHIITPRLMRHLYSMVLTLCPLMKYDTERAAWTVIWFDSKHERYQSYTSSLPIRTDAVALKTDGEILEPRNPDLSLLFGTAGVHKAW